LTPSLYHVLHAYVAWWVLLAVFLGIIALMVKYYPVNKGDPDDR
jgi:Na+/H+ antiporter NhaB